MSEHLDQDAREYFRWPIAAFDADKLPIAINVATITLTSGSGSVTRSGPIVDGKFAVFLAGPTAPPHEDAIVLPLGRTTYKIAITDVAERLVSAEGVIRVA